MFERQDSGDAPEFEPSPPGPIEKLIGSIIMAAIAGFFAVVFYDYFGVKGAIVFLASWLGMQSYSLNSLYNTYRRDHDFPS